MPPIGTGVTIITAGDVPILVDVSFSQPVYIDLNSCFWLDRSTAISGRGHHFVENHRYRLPLAHLTIFDPQIGKKSPSQIVKFVHTTPKSALYPRTENPLIGRILGGY